MGLQGVVHVRQSGAQTGAQLPRHTCKKSARLLAVVHLSASGVFGKTDGSLGIEQALVQPHPTQAPLCRTGFVEHVQGQALFVVLGDVHMWWQDGGDKFSGRITQGTGPEDACNALHLVITFVEIHIDLQGGG